MYDRYGESDWWDGVEVCILFVASSTVMSWWAWRFVVSAHFSTVKWSVGEYVSDCSATCGMVNVDRYGQSEWDEVTG